MLVNIFNDIFNIFNIIIYFINITAFDLIIPISKLYGNYRVASFMYFNIQYN